MSRRLDAPLRSVFDTNAFISALLFEHSTPGRAVRTALHRGVILVSAETVAELSDVVGRSKFDRYVTPEERGRFVSALVRRAELVEVHAPVAVCRDPRDDKFLSLALSGSGSVIVTGDEDLLVLHPFRDIEILTPAAFLKAVEHEEKD